MTSENDRPLKMDVRETESAAIVSISGSAGIREAEQMRVSLEELAGRQFPVIVLDLSDMDFICSTGLGAIIAAHLKSRHHQGEIRLVNPRPAVRDLLEITRLTKLFSIYADVSQAVSP